MSSSHESDIAFAPETEPAQPAAGAPRGDLSGRDRMGWNVLASWAGHAVFVVAGFVMPRLIDRHLGETALGVWDFAWSIIAYMGMVQIGVGASVSPYVARHRARHQIGEASVAVSSVLLVLLIAAAIVLLLSAIVGYYVPVLLHARFGAYMHEARWIIYLLGASLAVQVASTVFGGVITGCHRWDLHSATQAGFYALNVAGMIAALRLGGGLVALAWVMLVGSILAEAVRIALAYHVLPGLRVDLRRARWSVARTMIGFGGKSFLDSVSRLLLYQTSSILIVAYMGPAALAFYSRPAGLVRHGHVFLGKFGFVLTPMASSLHAMGDQRELQRLVVSTTRYAAYMALPLVLLLSVMGGPILQIWMGPQYVCGQILPILGIGHLLPMVQQPLSSILTGLNWHGRMAVANLLAALAAVSCSAIALGWFHWELTGVAVAVVVPLSLVAGLYMPWYACRSLHVPLGRYLVSSWGGAVIAEHSISALPTGGKGRLCHKTGPGLSFRHRRGRCIARRSLLVLGPAAGFAFKGSAKR